MVSKEEKAAKKLAKKLEKLRQQNEARKKQRRLELEREIKAQASKKDELDRTWREKMLKIKEPLFRKDIEVMWHVFERVYDKKDYYISSVIKLMKVADDQFQRTVASFCDTIDTMINNFLKELDALDEQNKRRTRALLKRGEDEEVTIRKDHDAAETHLQLMLYHAHTTADTLAWTNRGENIVKEDEDRLKYTNIRDDLRSFLENNYNSMWEQYKAVLKSYVVNTAENQKKVRKLRKKENVMADIIASQGKKIANSDGLLKRLRLDLQAYESGTKQAVFRDRRNRHRAACFKLKQNLINGCAKDEKQLDILVREGNSAIEWLEAALAKTEKILRMAELCRRYETQREKVLPYGSTIPHTAAQVKPAKSNTRRQNVAKTDSLVLNAVSSTCGLTRLWQRIAKADLSRRALIREKMLLEDENEYLVEQLQNSDTIKIESDTRECICVRPSKQSGIYKPVAVEAVNELDKYDKANMPL